MKTTKPDYEHWVKRENWTLKEAALLLHDIEPLEHRSLRLPDKDIPVEFATIQKTYFLLRSVPWQQRYRLYGMGYDPRLIIVEALDKRLPLPEELHQRLMEYYDEKLEKLPPKEEPKVEAEKVTTAPAQDDDADDDNEALTTRERKALLKTIGILVLLWLDKNNLNHIYKRGDKASAYQIGQTVIEKAQDINLDLTGLKSVNRKITEALEILEKELDSSEYGSCKNRKSLLRIINRDDNRDRDEDSDLD